METTQSHSYNLRSRKRSRSPVVIQEVEEEKEYIPPEIPFALQAQLAPYVPFYVNGGFYNFGALTALGDSFYYIAPPELLPTPPGYDATNDFIPEWDLWCASTDNSPLPDEIISKIQKWSRASIHKLIRHILQYEPCSHQIPFDQMYIVYQTRSRCFALQESETWRMAPSHMWDVSAYGKCSLCLCNSQNLKSFSLHGSSFCKTCIGICIEIEIKKASQFLRLPRMDGTIISMGHLSRVPKLDVHKQYQTLLDRLASVRTSNPSLSSFKGMAQLFAATDYYYCPFCGYAYEYGDACTHATCPRCFRKSCALCGFSLEFNSPEIPHAYRPINMPNASQFAHNFPGDDIFLNYKRMPWPHSPYHGQSCPIYPEEWMNILKIRFSHLFALDDVDSSTMFHTIRRFVFLASILKRFPKYFFYMAYSPDIQEFIQTHQRYLYTYAIVQ